MKTKNFYFMLIGLFIFSAIACNKDDDDDNDNGMDYSQFKIINNGNGAVNNITDTDDTEPLKIVQTVPSLSNYSWLSANKTALSSNRPQSPLTKAPGDGVFPANLPVMFFFNDKILLNTVGNNLVITVDGEEVKGTIVINEGANGYAILTFTPWKEFKVNKSISVIVKKGMQDDGGNEMLEDLVLSYTTEQGAKGNFDNNQGFESGDEGVTVLGDGGVVNGSRGDLSPQQGNRFGAISTGEGLITSGKWSIGGASSMLILGPVNKNINSLSFWYDFISAEFDDYVDSEFDDCAMVTISGPLGAYSAFITSVNTIRYNNTAMDYPQMPDGGDNKTGHIGWVQRTINFPSVGTPAYITFTVTDVSDTALSSILALDNLNY